MQGAGAAQGLPRGCPLGSRFPPITGRFDQQLRSTPAGGPANQRSPIHYSAPWVRRCRTAAARSGDFPLPLNTKRYELRDGTLLFTFGSAPTASSGAGQAVGTTTPPKAESSAQAASLPAEDVDSSKQEYPATAPQAASAAQYAIVPEKEHPLETSAPAQPADVSTAAAAAGLAPASAAADVNATPGAALIQCLNDMTVRVSGLNLPAPEMAELREKCRVRGLRSYFKLRKADLVQFVAKNM